MEYGMKVSVVTGSGQGIGRELALELAHRGCRLALADNDQDALMEVANEVAQMDVGVLAVHTDVSRSTDVKALAEQVLQRYGRIDLLFNNAGVAGGRRVWEYTDQDWQWQLGVNLLGTAYAIREFVPAMLKQGDGGYIVNTASAAGLFSAPGMAAYNASKHALVSLSETLQHELCNAGSDIAVSVVCPAWVRTRIWDSERYRPAHFRTDTKGQNVPPMKPNPQFKAALENSGMNPRDMALHILKGMEERRFYILPTARVADAFLRRAQLVKDKSAAFNPLTPPE